MPPPSDASAIRVALIDDDSGLLTVLDRRFAALRWQREVVGYAAGPDQLATAEGRVLEREDIYQRVWGYTMVRGDRSVDVFVRKLRQKLERISPAWRYVHTHFGVGYRFAAESEDAMRPQEPELPAAAPQWH